MAANESIRFFDAQFQRQVREGDLRLNPFEEAALPYLHGRVLDFGCGLGNLSVAAARRGCNVVALDASPTAIAHLRATAEAASLSIEAVEADLQRHVLRENFDAVVCIGLLMFFDCATARAQFSALRSHVRPGGVAVFNALVEGTTYLDMFDPSGYCLFAPEELARGLAGWEILLAEQRRFPAPEGRAKVFSTVIARRPPAGGLD
jgi:tellurite methyltransferase